MRVRWLTGWNGGLRKFGAVLEATSGLGAKWFSPLFVQRLFVARPLDARHCSRHRGCCGSETGLPYHASWSGWAPRGRGCVPVGDHKSLHGSPGREPVLGAHSHRRRVKPHWAPHSPCTQTISSRGGKQALGICSGRGVGGELTRQTLIFLRFWGWKCKVRGRLSPEAAVLGDSRLLPVPTHGLPSAWEHPWASACPAPDERPHLHISTSLEALSANLAPS